jgi:hypothetical protein
MRPKAQRTSGGRTRVIFTGGVVKDLIGNPSYGGKVLVEGELVPGPRPALVDETWRACQDVKKRNVKRTGSVWTNTYPLILFRASLVVWLHIALS